LTGSQALKFVQAIAPGAIVDNAAFTGTVIDTLGFNYLTLVIMFGAMDIAMAALKVTECDTSGGSYTDIPGADFSVSPATLPSATDDNHLFGVHINLQTRKRYIKIAATGGDGAAGTYATGIGVLSKGETVPSDAAGRGFTQDLTVIS
jgi:hypothetical protein